MTEGQIPSYQLYNNLTKAAMDWSRYPFVQFHNKLTEAAMEWSRYPFIPAS